MERYHWILIAFMVSILSTMGFGIYSSYNRHHAKRTACLEEMGRAHVSPKRAVEVCP